MPRAKKSTGDSSAEAPPAKTLESRENQMIAMAYDLAEKRLREGTASAQEITHFLKIGTTTHQLEKKKLEKDIELTAARTAAADSSSNLQVLYEEAINAMRRYQGVDQRLDEDDVD